MSYDLIIRDGMVVDDSHRRLGDNGLLHTGKIADTVVFDPDRIAVQMPMLENNLPAGVQRLKQKATGVLVTIVNDAVVPRNNEHTGATPGALLRGPLSSNGIVTQDLGMWLRAGA